MPPTPAAAAARALLDVGRAAQAIVVLGPAVANDPDDPQLWCLLSWALLESPETPHATQRAADAAREAIRVNPGEEWPHRLLSIAYQRQHKLTEALAAAERAVDAAPQSWLAQVNLTDALARTPQRRGDAWTAARRAVKLAPPDEPGPHLTIAAMALEDGDLAEAEQAARTVLTMAPDNPRALRYLARVQDKRSETPQALETLQAAIAADPSQQHAKSELDDVLTTRLLTEVVVLVVLYGALIAVAPLQPARWHALLTVSLSVGVTLALWITTTEFASIAGYARRQLRRTPAAVAAIGAGVASLVAAVAGGVVGAIDESRSGLLRIALMLSLVAYVAGSIANSRTSVAKDWAAARDARLPTADPRDQRVDRWRLTILMGLGHLTLLAMLTATAIWLPVVVFQGATVVAFLIAVLADSMFGWQAVEGPNPARRSVAVVVGGGGQLVIGAYGFGWALAAFFVPVTATIIHLYTAVVGTAALLVVSLGGGYVAWRRLREHSAARRDRQSR